MGINISVQYNSGFLPDIVLLTQSYLRGTRLNTMQPVAPVAQRYHVTSDTLGREFDPGKRDFSH